MSFDSAPTQKNIVKPVVLTPEKIEIARLQNEKLTLQKEQQQLINDITARMRDVSSMLERAKIQNEMPENKRFTKNGEDLAKIDANLEILGVTRDRGDSRKKRIANAMRPATVTPAEDVPDLPKDLHAGDFPAIKVSR